MRATRLLLSTLTALTLTALAAAGCTGGGRQVTGGPLVAPNPHGFAMRQPVGFVFTDGVETLELGGHRPAVLRNVEAVGTRGLRIVGVALAKPGRKFGTIQEIDGWPPKDPYLRPSDVISPGIGARFTPSAHNKLGQSYELLVGMKVVKPGYLVRKGFWITYEVAGTTYRQFFPAQLAVRTVH